MPSIAQDQESSRLFSMADLCITRCAAGFASQGQRHLAYVRDCRGMLDSRDDALRQFHRSLFAQALVGCSEGDACPGRGVKQALREPKRIRMSHGSDGKEHIRNDARVLR